MTVQRDTVVKEIANLIFFGGDDGIIRLFGVLVNQLPTGFWCDFGARMLEALPEEKKEAFRKTLIECALEGGYHVAHGMVESAEFKGLVGPMITEGPKDVIRGLLAAFTAGGWAKMGLVQLADGERMVVRAQDYYEADGAQGPNRAYLVQGMSKAIMDLEYGPGEYPASMGAFQCEQTQGIESGAPYGEFVVTKK